MSNNLTLLILALLLPLSGWAQGVLTGRITDRQGLPLPGATVGVPALGKGGSSDVSGQFILTGIPGGSHTLEVSYLGYAPLSQDFSIEDGKTTRLDFVLEQGAISAGEVLVLGDRLQGQAKALSQQRSNSNITNIVSSDQVGRFPDANIGDAMKRIPGITMQFDQGEARDIIIRGMAPQLNAVTLNGERIPSAEGDNRRVQMDLIPSDMIQTIEVNKAVLPEMDADAIGGSVNLVTRTAPSGLRVSGTLGSGINLLSNKPIWTGGLVLGNRFLNDRLGVVLSGSYHNHNFGSDNIEAVWSDTDAGVVIDELDIRKYIVQRVRRSINGSIDYRLSDNHTIGLSAMYNWRDDWENRFRMRVSQLADAFDDGNFTELGEGVYTAKGRVEYQTKGGLNDDRQKGTRLEDQRMYNFTLNGQHLFGGVQATWNVTMARASEERPHERYIAFRRSGRDVEVDISDPERPFTYLLDPAENLTLPLNTLSEQYSYTEDQDLNGRLDFRIPYSDAGYLKVGGRFRNKQKFRDNNFFEYEPLSGFDNLGSVPNRDESDSGFLPGTQYAVGTFVTPEFLGDLNLKDAGLFDESDQPSEYASVNYEAEESIYGGYLSAHHNLGDKLSLVAGLRYEFTDITYTGNIFDVDEEIITPTTRSNTYGNLLPGLHLRYAPSQNTVLRAAWTNTLARPNYYDLVPYAEFSPADNELFRGNPDLKATTSANFDLMAEHYFRSIGLVSIGGFHKRLDNFIYRQTSQNYNDPVFGSDLEYSRPLNGGNARVTGLEASFQRQIWKGLGLYTNYTFTASSTEGIEGREDDDLALPGTARHMFNASLSYETKRLVVRVSMNYASDYVDEVGGDAQEDRFYDKQTFLDVNASYAVTPKIRIFAEGNNLTDQPLRYYQGIPSRTMQAEYYNARYTLGVKFDLNAR